MRYVVIQRQTRTALASFEDVLDAMAWKNLCCNPLSLCVERRRKDYRKGDYVPQPKGAKQ
jgi:hypothetical protein